MEKTPWFKASEHAPVRPGIYLVRTPNLQIILWREFDGKDWIAGVPAFFFGKPVSSPPRGESVDKITRRDFEWCGLAKEPK